MELRPGKPERLVAANVRAIGVNGANAAPVELKAHVFERNVLSVLECNQCLAALKRHRAAGRGDCTDDIFMDGQPQVHAANRENGAVGVAGVAEIGVAPKRVALLIVLTVVLALPAGADERKSFLGTWGSADQCAHSLIKPNGSVRAQPFVISQGSLRHGDVWCRLDWGPVETHSNGLFTGAHARCGEDSVRQHFVGMMLSGGELSLRWDFLVMNGPLGRCSAS